MKIYGVQLDIQWENKAANYERVRELIQEAAPEPGSLIVLPEMFATGFSMNVAKITENACETEKFLSELAHEFSVVVLGGLATVNADGRGRNEAYLALPDGSEQSAPVRYCKMHPFTFSGENKHFAPGEEAVIFEWQGFSVAPFICYDLRFPEIFRSVTKQGAHLFCVIANWPASRDVHWRALLLARAIENQAYVIGVNRCGDDPKLNYAGRSQIISPRGEIIADADSEEGVISVELDLLELQNYRREFPALADMRFA
ncbi:MAG TPA: carbon-nitrogen family hydrolase [Abditibacteriaceae bacterium]|jgi:predicted amidohydrolase